MHLLVCSHIGLWDIMKVTCLIVLISWTFSITAAPTENVEQFVDVYNQHDIEKMLERTSEEVKWLFNLNSG